MSSAGPRELANEWIGNTVLDVRPKGKYIPMFGVTEDIVILSSNQMARTCIAALTRASSKRYKRNTPYGVNTPEAY